MTASGPISSARARPRSRRAPGSRRARSGRRRRPARRSRAARSGGCRASAGDGRSATRPASSRADDPGRIDRRGRDVACRSRRPSVISGRGREVAQAQARRSQPADPPVAGRVPGLARAARVRSAQIRSAPGQPAGDVVADVGDDRRPRLRRVQRVERRDAVRLGRRDGQPLRDVVERRLADPADPRLDRVEGRQQLVAPGAGRVPALRGVPVGARRRARHRPSPSRAARGRRPRRHARRATRAAR